MRLPIAFVIFVVATRMAGMHAAAAQDASPDAMIRFAAPWTSPYRVDPSYPFHLVNGEGKHLFVLNKTAWAYFGCEDPLGVLDRALLQRVNVLRVALEGTPYFEHLGIDLWPWGGTRSQPDWSRFNESYWNEVERRVRLAGQRGIGLDIVLNMGLHPKVDQIDQQRPYWQEAVRRLAKYANILTWEIANEYTANEAFQDAAGAFFQQHDPYHRPVCTSDGTTDDAVWPDKPWMDLAINHSCTSSTPKHGLGDWYLAVARNTRSHGKPAFCNESGREKRHKNDDAIHRRKQGWLWSTAGCFWTYHSWEGCEGIDDADYRGPGQEFLKPMAQFFAAIPFWRMAPCETAIKVRYAERRSEGGDPSLSSADAGRPNPIAAVLAEPDRSTVAAYLCMPNTGARATGMEAVLRLPAGRYRVTILSPADLTVLETHEQASPGLGKEVSMRLPDFADDLALRLEMVAKRQQTPMAGTR